MLFWRNTLFISLLNLQTFVKCILFEAAGCSMCSDFVILVFGVLFTIECLFLLTHFTSDYSPCGSQSKVFFRVIQRGSVLMQP